MFGIYAFGDTRLLPIRGIIRKSGPNTLTPICAFFAAIDSLREFFYRGLETRDLRSKTLNNHVSSSRISMSDPDSTMP